jgi:hypothetical protein
MTPINAEGLPKYCCLTCLHSFVSLTNNRMFVFLLNAIIEGGFAALVLTDPTAFFGPGARDGPLSVAATYRGVAMLALAVISFIAFLCTSLR